MAWWFVPCLKPHSEGYVNTPPSRSTSISGGISALASMQTLVPMEEFCMGMSFTQLRLLPHRSPLAYVHILLLSLPYSWERPSHLELIEFMSLHVPLSRFPSPPLPSVPFTKGNFSSDYFYLALKSNYFCETHSSKWTPGSPQWLQPEERTAKRCPFCPHCPAVFPYRWGFPTLPGWASDLTLCEDERSQCSCCVSSDCSSHRAISKMLRIILVNKIEHFSITCQITFKFIIWRYIVSHSFIAHYLGSASESFFTMSSLPPSALPLPPVQMLLVFPQSLQILPLYESFPENSSPRCKLPFWPLVICTANSTVLNR